MCSERSHVLHLLAGKQGLKSLCRLVAQPSGDSLHGKICLQMSTQDHLFTYVEILANPQLGGRFFATVPGSLLPYERRCSILSFPDKPVRRCNED
jgi:hypothetical protein